MPRTQSATSTGAEIILGSMYGYNEAEALRMNLRDLIPENRRQEEFAYLERLHSGEHIESWEAQRITRDGRTVDVWLTATTLKDETGALVAISTTERDVTERWTSSL